MTIEKVPLNIIGLASGIAVIWQGWERVLNGHVVGVLFLILGVAAVTLALHGLGIRDA